MKRFIRWAARLLAPSKQQKPQQRKKHVPHPIRFICDDTDQSIALLEKLYELTPSVKPVFASAAMFMQDDRFRKVRDLVTQPIPEPPFYNVVSFTLRSEQPPPIRLGDVAGREGASLTKKELSEIVMEQEPPFIKYWTQDVPNIAHISQIHGTPNAKELEQLNRNYDAVLCTDTESCSVLNSKDIWPISSPLTFDALKKLLLGLS